MSSQSISYVVGEEKGLLEILRAADVLPLMRGAIRAGAAEAMLVNVEGAPICVEKSAARHGEVTIERPLHLEGEPVGNLLVKGEEGETAHLTGLADLLLVAVNTILANNLKRMLTAEMHTTVVSQSYEELLATNRRLIESEASYRDLAESLEVKVRERSAALETAHARLLQQEKMASIGQLAAGVAHEINNPLGFIISNLSTMQKYVLRFVAMLDHFRDGLRSGDPAAVIAQRAGEKWRELKIDLVRGDIGDLLTQSLSGAERVKRIVADLKGFSHVDEAEELEVDLNEEIDRTLHVLAHQTPAGAVIARDYQTLPPYRCQPALICQVFLNIIQNALAVRSEGLKLTIVTRAERGHLVVSIADNGPGVPRELRGRIFEPFFTTRQVGAGTGMGLAVVFDILKQCGGSVEVGDAPEGGALFTVTLPCATAGWEKRQ